MEIRITYIGTLNGINGIWCGFKPDNTIINEERLVLYADNGYELIRKSDGESVGSSVWLKDGDSQDNYSEVEVEQDI